MSSDRKREMTAPAGSWEKKKDGRGRVTAFYIETLLLAVIFAAVILVLVRVFSLAVGMGARAEDLTGAVRLAENAAEAVSASESAQELAALLDENGNVSLREDGDVLAEYGRDMRPAPGGPIQVEITWQPQGDGCVNSVITVRRAGEDQPVYTLTTAVYTGEAAQ